MTAVLDALGWALVHSLWQLALVGLAGSIAQRAAGSLRARYLCAMGALGLCLALPVLTFLRGLAFHGTPLPIADPTPVLRAAVLTAPVPPAPGPTVLEVLQGALAARVTLIAGLWALGASLMAVRLAGGIHLAGRWRRTSLPAPEAWEGRFRDLASRMGVGGRAALRVSLRVATPVALGLARPVVLVPASLLAAMPEPYLEALLAHELAHLARRDYLAGILQGAVEVLCFHHPAVWFLSRRARALRELLADEAAAGALGEPRRLALALDALDDLQQRLPALALSARGGSLHDRIHRLLRPAAPKGAPWLAVPVLALLLPCAALAMGAQIPAGPPIAGHPEAVATLDRIAREEGVDPQLLRSLGWVESGLVAVRRSKAGATGLLQVTPETARRFGAQDLSDRVQVDRAGARYLKSLLVSYHGDVDQAVTAYTCGADAPEAAKSAARGYASLVKSLLESRAVQPAAALPRGGVEGTFLRQEDGSLVLDVHLSSTGNPVDLAILPAAEGAAAPIARLTMGGVGRDAGGPWTESWPRIILKPLPPGTRVRVRYALPGEGLAGETEVVLDGPWKTFELRTSPVPAAR
jgi:beta-lactamase regulating signal transducer with metallopeptidase domain